MGVFQKNNAWWIDYYTDSGQRKREKIGGPLTRAMEGVAKAALNKRRVEIAEGKFLDKRKVPRVTFAEAADKYLDWSSRNHRDHIGTKWRILMMAGFFYPWARIRHYAFGASPTLTRFSVNTVLCPAWPSPKSTERL